MSLLTIGLVVLSIAIVVFVVVFILPIVRLLACIRYFGVDIVTIVDKEDKEFVNELADSVLQELRSIAWAGLRIVEKVEPETLEIRLLKVAFKNLRQVSLENLDEGIEYFLSLRRSPVSIIIKETADRDSAKKYVRREAELARMLRMVRPFLYLRE